VSHPKRNEAKRRPVAEATAHAQRSLAVSFARPKFLCVSTVAGKQKPQNGVASNGSQTKKPQNGVSTYLLQKPEMKFPLLFGKAKHK